MKNFYKMKLKVLCAVLFMLAWSNVSRGQLIINEVYSFLAPVGDGSAAAIAKSDADGDGVRNTTNDEFIEFINSSTSPLDIGGWSVTTTTTTNLPGTLQHIFPTGTIIPGGGVLVLFGGPAGKTPAQFPNIFGGSILQVADDNGDTSGGNAGLTLTDAGSTIRIFDVSAPTAASTPVITFAYGTAASSTVSAGNAMTRLPDLTGSLSAGSNHPLLNDRNISPGLRTDGTAFSQTSIKFSDASASVSEGSNTYDLTIQLIYPLGATADTEFDVVLTSGNNSDLGGYTTQHKTVTAGTATVTVSVPITDDALLEAGEQFTFAIQNVTNGTSPVISTPSAFTLTVQDNDVTTVSFASATGVVSEDAGTCQITLSIQSPSATFDTSVEVVRTSGNATDISNYDRQTVTFPANTSANRTVTLTLANNTTIDADRAITFELQNVSQPGGSAVIGTGNTFTLTISNDDESPLVINEFCAFPSVSGSGVDANGDGSTNGNTDEFLELVNSGTTDLDISHWTIYGHTTTPTLRYTFGSNVVLKAGEAIVIFGAWNTTTNPAVPTLIGGSRVFFGDVSAGATASLGMANAGATIQIKNGSGMVQREYTFPGTEAVNSVSRLLDPEITGTAYIAHPALAGKTISPGTKADGTNFIEVVPDTQVSFASGSATISEGDGTYQLQVTIANPDAANATSADIVLTQGDAAALNGFQSASVNFTGATPGDQSVNLTITDNQVAETNKTFTFEIRNVQGGHNAAAGGLSTFTLTVTDDDAVTGASLVINEVHPRLELSPNGDTNGDGTRSTTDDEFIEFMNVTSADLDVSGWKVMTGTGTGVLQHIFPEATILPAGGALLLFGGGSPDEGAFSGAMVQKADDGTGAIGLSLTDQSSTVKVLNASGVLQDEVTYFSESSAYAGISIARNPDGGAFTFDAQQRALPNHPSVMLGDGRQHQYSPGIKTDGAPFIEITTTTVQFATTSGGRYENDASPSPVAITIERAHATQPTTFDIVLDTPDPDGELSFSPTSFTFIPGEPETQHINITIQDDALLEGDEVFVFRIINARGGDHAAPGKNKTFSFRIYDNDMPVIFNEVHATPATDITGDANHDGARGAAEDEFVELVNVTDEVIDMSGWKLYSNNDVLRHVFLPGSRLQPQKALVIFGGGVPLGYFGGSKFQIASEGGLGLADNGTVLILKNKTDELRSSFTYGNEGNIRQSLTRNPDITGYYVPHSQAEQAGGTLYSPGIRTNGWPFGDVTTGTMPEQASAVSFYPNPARAGATISIIQSNATFEYVIHDIAGSLVKHARGATGQASVDLGNLRAGIYFYTVRDPGNGNTLGKGKFTVIR